MIKLVLLQFGFWYFKRNYFFLPLKYNYKFLLMSLSSHSVTHSITMEFWVGTLKFYLYHTPYFLPFLVLLLMFDEMPDIVRFIFLGVKHFCVSSHAWELSSEKHKSQEPTDSLVPCSWNLLACADGVLRLLLVISAAQKRFWSMASVHYPMNYKIQVIVQFSNKGWVLLSAVNELRAVPEGLLVFLPWPGSGS